LCIKQDYSSPVTVAGEIDTGLLGMKRHLPGVKLDGGEFNSLGEILASFSDEFPWRCASNCAPEVPWGEMFPTLDSMVLYAMIRHFKPANYIEVGCGYSSHVSSNAARRNQEEGIETRVKYIEPYPSERLAEANLCGELVVKKIQEVPFALFESLKPGDMLFIDTSHIMKCQSDVEWELLHILPILPKGVIVHIHDIYTPYEQPLGWLENRYAPGLYNEQYAVEALLSGGSRFRTLFPNHYLCREKPEFLEKWFGIAKDSSRSYWIIVD
jgi:hypothetical protein